ncbi:MAG: Gfo/Idh/MocA family protein [Spirochaetia bacterium]
MKKAKVGIIGCGIISDIYLKNLTSVFSNTEVHAVADLVRDKAEEKAEKYGIPKVLSTEKLLKDKDIDIVLNLTIPKVHGDIALAALKAGKHVYNEKPLTIKRSNARKILETAKKKKLRVGCAPDTFLGAGLQTCRDVIEQGVIGEVIGATAFMTCRGHESWHADPEFYYKAGGGPLFDMGPYYITALISLAGPVKRVSGTARVTFPTRTITSEPKNGTIIDVDVPTHLSGSLDFKNGAIGTIIMSFDVWGANLPRIEVFGSKGSLSVPDPNSFSGAVKLLKEGKKEWEEIPVERNYAENSRGLGVADMARAIEKDEPHRANGNLAYHVLDIMHSFHDSSELGRHIRLKSSCSKPALLEKDTAL